MKYKVHTIVKKRRKTRVIKSIIALVALVLIGVTFLMIMRSEFFRLEKIEIRGNVVISTDEILLQSQNIIFGNYLYFLPKNNVLILPKSALKKALLTRFSRIQDISMNLNGATLVISITERKPDSLWCGLSFSETIDPCLFIDETGYVFSKAPQFDGSSFIKFYGAGLSASSTTVVSIVAGTSTATTTDIDVVNSEKILESKQGSAAWKFLTDEEYLSLKDFILNLKESGIDIDSVEISDYGTYVFQIRDNGILLLKRIDVNEDLMKSNLESSLANLQAALESKSLYATSSPRDSKNPRIADFEYIDLRFGNKIFYKKR